MRLSQIILTVLAAASVVSSFSIPFTRHWQRSDSRRAAEAGSEHLSAPLYERLDEELLSYLEKRRGGGGSSGGGGGHSSGSSGSSSGSSGSSGSSSGSSGGAKSGGTGSTGGGGSSSGSRGSTRSIVPLFHVHHIGIDIVTAPRPQ